MLLAVAEAVGDGGRSEQRVGHELEMRSLIRASWFPAGLDGCLDVAATRQKLPGVVQQDRERTTGARDARTRTWRTRRLKQSLLGDSRGGVRNVLHVGLASAHSLISRARGPRGPPAQSQLARYHPFSLFHLRLCSCLSSCGQLDHLPAGLRDRREKHHGLPALLAGNQRSSGVPEVPIFDRPGHIWKP